MAQERFVMAKRTRFRFSSLGPISEAELELGDLTIIAGRNNTGKTYLTYVLYEFLKRVSIHVLYSKAYSRLFESHLMETTGLSKKAFMELLTTSGSYDWNVDEHTYFECQSELINILSSDYSSEIGSHVFQSPPGKLDDAKFDLIYSQTPPGPWTSIYSFLGGQELRFEFRDSRAVAIFRGGTSENESQKAGAVPEKDYVFQLLRRMYASFLLSNISEIRLTPFILTSARNSISLFYKELDFVRNQAVRLFQSQQDREGEESDGGVDPAGFTSRYATAISDNIDSARNISSHTARVSSSSQNFLSKSIEEMMGGYFASINEEWRFIASEESRFSFDIPFHLASSSAWEMSHLYFFLNHSLDYIDLLIIDEPESHLDTANQIQLARLLARYVNSGKKVLVTTHSDYIIREINNLIMLSSPLEDGDEARKKLGYREDDRLSQEQVQAYVAKNGTLNLCSKDRFGIEMPVFDETIDDLNDRSEELADQIMMKKSGE